MVVGLGRLLTLENYFNLKEGDRVENLRAEKIVIFNGDYFSSRITQVMGRDKHPVTNADLGIRIDSYTDGVESGAEVILPENLLYAPANKLLTEAGL